MVGFEEWYGREHRRLVASMLALSGRSDLACDAADEAFARAFGAWGRVQRFESPSGWVYRVALNVLRRSIRRQSLERRLLRRPGELVLPVPTDPDLWEAVRALPARQRQAVVLRFVADLTEPDIASAMGVTRGTVSSTLRDAYRRLGSLVGTPPEEVRQ